MLNIYRYANGGIVVENDDEENDTFDRNDDLKNDSFYQNDSMILDDAERLVLAKTQLINNDFKELVCKACMKPISNLANLKRHLETVHINKVSKNDTQTSKILFNP